MILGYWASERCTSSPKTAYDKGVELPSPSTKDVAMTGEIMKITQHHKSQKHLLLLAEN